jgi:hypothetical protein
MNNELNDLDDDLFTPITEQERAHLIGAGKTRALTSSTSFSPTMSPTGSDIQLDQDVDIAKDQTGLN